MQVEDVSIEPTVSSSTGTGAEFVDDRPIDFYPLGTTTVTFTAAGLGGSVAECVTDVTVVDQTPPTVSCDAMVEMECEAAVAG